MAIKDISTEFLFELELKLASAKSSAYNVGPTPSGHRIAGGIVGGRVTGPRINGDVEPIGADFAVLRSDDALAPNVSTVIRADEGDLIAVRYRGLIHPWSTVQALRAGGDVDPDEIEWKVFMLFETSSPQYDWLNRTLAVARGSVGDGGFRYRAHALI